MFKLEVNGETTEHQTKAAYLAQVRRVLSKQAAPLKDQSTYLCLVNYYPFPLYLADEHTTITASYTQ